MRILHIIFSLLFFTNFCTLPAQDTIEQHINYRRLNKLPLENYNPADKENYFPVKKPVNSSSGIWTELNPNVPRVDYLGIYFINKDTGFAVGAYGALIKTTDGGVSWETKESNTANPLLKIRNFNDDIIIASGFDGIIIRSTDGGDNWQNVNSPVTGDLWGLFAVNDSVGWVCGNYNSLIKTTDAGISWQVVQTPGYTADYWWIDFLNVDYGFIAANGKVLKTSDGGNTWEIFQAGDDYPLFSIDLIDSLHIAAAGYGGTSYRGKNIYSSDAGYTWTNGGQLTFEAVNCIQYVDPDTGYLVMTNVSARKTTNRGEEWITLQGISDHYELQFLDILNDRIGISAGTGLKLSRAEGNLNIWNRLIINDNFADVYFISEKKGFAISGILSQIQALYKTTNSGINWESVPGAPSGNDLLFLDSLTGFIGSDVIYKTTDGGDTWYIPNGGSEGAGKFFFINDMTGWAIRSNRIYKTTDRGENWITQFTAPTSIGFKGIYFIDSLIGWTANFGGRPFKTTNGGDSWIQQTNLDIWQSEDVFFKDYLNGFIINGILELLRTTDSGINWFQQLNSQYVIRSFGWLSPSHGFIVGDGVYETADSGNTWNEILELRNVGLRKLQSPKNYIGYLIGNLGLIYRYIDTSIVPVELISFEGRIGINEITLSWITVSELNNQGFYIEKSYDRLNWETIGFIVGKGTTTEINYYSFVDNKTIEGEINYRLKQLDIDGTFTYSKVITIDINKMPVLFDLLQNYPNPFNAATRITFNLPVDSRVKLTIFDVLGKEIKSIINKEMIKGNYNIDFDASDLNSGIYFYSLRAEGIDGKKYNLTKKMILLK